MRCVSPDDLGIHGGLGKRGGVKIAVVQTRPDIDLFLFCFVFYF